MKLTPVARRLRRHGEVLAGLAVATAFALGLAALPAPARETMRERAIDAVLRLAAVIAPPPAPALPVVLVDIDADTLAAQGAWPWPRARLAALVEACLRAGAGAVALDILLEGPDPASPATLARRLADALGRPDLAAWAGSLPDGDAALAAVFAQGPVALGFAMPPAGGEPLPAPPLLLRGHPTLAGVWQVPGAIAPDMALRRAAAGLGALPLPGSADGVIRRAPLLVGVGGRVQPGLAAEAVRLAQGATAYRLDGDTLAIGAIALPLAPDGQLRLLPWEDIATIPAHAMLYAPPPLGGALVVIGSSAPALGGLRATAQAGLAPSAMIQAAAARQILRGVAPAPIAPWLPPALGLAATVAGLLLGAAARPARGAATAAALAVAAWLAAALAAGGTRGWLVDPLPPTLLLAAAFLATSIAAAARTQLREAAIRRRFAQHLAPQVVALIAADAGRTRLPSEQREVTALFTDIEDFTALTRRAGPEALVAILDGYFEGAARIIHRHGGMIDKLVGDAIHAFFNMPLDQPDHAWTAVRCAMEIRAWSETYRAAGLPAALGMGRTRIGIETGPALVGEVGLGTKLDYTAHGDPVNAAARLEAANKELGSAICIGPAAAARCPPDALRAIGEAALRGLGTVVTAYEPWAPGDPAATRAAWHAAWSLRGSDPDAAATRFAAIAAQRPDDAVAARLAKGSRGVPPQAVAS